MWFSTIFRTLATWHAVYYEWWTTWECNESRYIHFEPFANEIVVLPWQHRCIPILQENTLLPDRASNHPSKLIAYLLRVGLDFHPCSRLRPIRANRMLTPPHVCQARPPLFPRLFSGRKCNKSTVLLRRKSHFYIASTFRSIVQKSRWNPKIQQHSGNHRSKAGRW